MTGSSAVHIVVPVVTLVTLAFWIAMVYHADSHPWYKASKRDRTGGVRADHAQLLRDVPPPLPTSRQPLRRRRPGRH